MGWPGVGYVSLEDVEGYPEHLARLVTDAPPSVAALASVTWNEARIAEWHEMVHKIAAVWQAVDT